MGKVRGPGHETLLLKPEAVAPITSGANPDLANAAAIRNVIARNDD